MLHDFDNNTESAMPTNDMKTNIGYEMLKKQGWTETTGLGKSRQGTVIVSCTREYDMKCVVGIIEPVSIRPAERGAGLGSTSSALTGSELNLPESSCERRKLDVEHQENTTDIRQQRNEEAKRQEILQDEIKNMNREFYCEVCDKQYKNVAEVASASICNVLLNNYLDVESLELV